MRSWIAGSGRRYALSATVAALALLAALPAQAQKITVWGGYPEMAPFYQRVADQMRKKHPGIEIAIDPITVREHDKRVALSLPAGSAADILELQQDSTRYVEAGLIPAAPAKVSEFVKAHYDKFFQDAMSSEGTIYGVPLFRGQTALYYNKDMFQAAGLTEPPKTMAEYDSYAQKLTQRDAAGAPVVSGWSLRLTGGGQGTAEKFWINLHQFGGTILKEKDGKWYADYASEAGRAAMKQYLHNVFVSKTVTPAMKADAEAFELGQTAMFIRESWVIGDIAQKAPKLNYATAPLPRGALVIPVGLYVPSKGKQAELAWEFVLAANEPENLIWLLENVGWLPNRKDVDYSSVVTKIPAFKAFVSFPETYELFSLPAIGPINEILTRLAVRLVDGFANAAMAQNDAAIDAFLKEAATESDAILKREDLLAAR